MNIAFDLDGTLISCAKRQSAVLRSILNALSLDADIRQIWDDKREGFSTEAALVRFGMSVTCAAQVADKWKRLIEEPYWLSLDGLFIDSRQVLSKLRHQGHSLTLITARSRKDLLMFQLAQLGIRDEFDQICAVQPINVKEQKSTELRARGATCFFGDSESDFEAARIADVPFYGVSTGQRSASFLQTRGVEHIFDTLQDASDYMQNKTQDRTNDGSGNAG